MSRRVREYVVFVTGSSGFLGQHVVGLLHNFADHVTEIRVLDTRPYVNDTGDSFHLIVLFECFELTFS